MLLLTARFEHLSMEERKKLHDTLTNQGLFTGILTKIVGRFLSKWIPRISITLMQTKKWTSTRSSNTSTSSARVLTSSVMTAVLLHTYLDSMIRSWVPVRDEFPVICLQSTKGNVNFHEVDISTVPKEPNLESTGCYEVLRNEICQVRKDHYLDTDLKDYPRSVLVDLKRMYMQYFAYSKNTTSRKRGESGLPPRRRDSQKG